MDARLGRGAPLPAATVRLLLVGLGLGCASMLVAARGGGGSGSLAPVVIAGSMPAVMLASLASALGGRSLGADTRVFGWAAGGTLALFGAVLGWMVRGIVADALPSWPLTLLLAVCVALPAVIGSARTRRHDHG